MNAMHESVNGGKSFGQDGNAIWTDLVTRGFLLFHHMEIQRCTKISHIVVSLESWTGPIP